MVDTNDLIPGKGEQLAEGHPFSCGSGTTASRWPRTYSTTEGGSVKHWARLCVDMDTTGHPIGTSWEKHVGETVISFGTGPEPGPFDEPIEAYLKLFEWYVSTHGLEQHIL